MGTSGSDSTADVSDEITADTLGIVSGTKIVTATSKDTSVAEVTNVVRESADVSADIGSPVERAGAVASTNASAGTYIKSFKITAVGAGSTYIDVKIIDTATSEESHKYIPVKVSSDKKLKSKTAAAIKSEVTDKNPSENEGDTMYKVTVKPTENGTVTATPSAGVAEGAEVTLEIKPDPGYALGTLTVDGADKTADVAEGKYTFTMPGHDVTVSAAFKSIYSTGLVGDIVISDGKYITAENYTKYKSIVDASNETAIAVIFDADKKLGVGLKQGTNLAWATGTTGFINKITTLLATKTGGSNASDAEFSGAGANDGSESLTNFRTVVGVNSSGKLDSDDYPAWAWIEGYAATANLTGTSYASGWYMPSIGELCGLYKVKEAVNNSIEKTGDAQIFTSNWYWSSSQSASVSHDAWDVSFGSGDLGDDDGNKGSTLSVCAVRAFN